MAAHKKKRVTNATLYRAAMGADAAFERELQRVYGSVGAPNMRYRTREFRDAKLKAAFARKVKADRALYLKTSGITAAEFDRGMTREARRNPKPRAAKRGTTGAPKRTRKTYRARVQVPRGNPITKEFRAVSDKAALAYANGLMLHKLPKGARVSSLQPVTASAKKKTR
jgi:hypothetical protein